MKITKKILRQLIRESIGKNILAQKHNLAKSVFAQKPGPFSDGAPEDWSPKEMVNYASSRKGYEAFENMKISFLGKKIDIENLPGENQPTTDKKPSGLWYGCGIDWMMFAHDEYKRAWFGAAGYVYDLTLTYTTLSSKNKNAVLKIDNDNTVKLFHEKYKSDEDEKYINWKKVSADFGGIEICPWPRVTYKWLKWWDMPSGCIWNKNGLANIRIVYTPEEDEIEPYEPVEEMWRQIRDEQGQITRDAGAILADDNDPAGNAASIVYDSYANLKQYSNPIQEFIRRFINSLDKDTFKVGGSKKVTSKKEFIEYLENYDEYSEYDGEKWEDTSVFELVSKYVKIKNDYGYHNRKLKNAGFLEIYHRFIKGEEEIDDIQDEAIILFTILDAIASREQLHIAYRQITDRYGVSKEYSFENEDMSKFSDRIAKLGKLILDYETKYSTGSFFGYYIPSYFAENLQAYYKTRRK